MNLPFAPLLLCALFLFKWILRRLQANPSPKQQLSESFDYILTNFIGSRLDVCSFTDNFETHILKKLPKKAKLHYHIQFLSSKTSFALSMWFALLNGAHRSVEVSDFSAEFEITRNLHAQFIVYEGLSKKDRNLRGHSLNIKTPKRLFGAYINSRIC